MTEGSRLSNYLSDKCLPQIIHKQPALPSVNYFRLPSDPVISSCDPLSFPSSVKPFHDCGEFPISPMDAMELKFRQIFVVPKLQETLNRLAAQSNSTLSRQEAKEAKYVMDSLKNLEGSSDERRWSAIVTANRCVDFAHENATSWTVQRSLNLLKSSWLTALRRSFHFEETIQDFILDFLIPKVLPSVLNASQSNHDDRVHIPELLSVLISRHVPVDVVASYLQATRGAILSGGQRAYNRCYFFLRATLAEVDDALQQLDSSHSSQRDLRHKRDFYKLVRSRMIGYLHALVRFLPEVIVRSQATFSLSEIMTDTNDIRTSSSSLLFAPVLKALVICDDANDEAMDSFLAAHLTPFYASISQLIVDGDCDSHSDSEGESDTESESEDSDGEDTGAQTSGKRKQDVRKCYLSVLDRFLRLTRFATLTHLTPPAIERRRRLLHYLLHQAKSLVSSAMEAQDLALRWRLLALYEAVFALHLCGHTHSHAKQVKQLQQLLHTRHLHPQFPAVYLAHHPEVTVSDLQHMLKTDNNNSDQQQRYLYMFLELLALIETVPLLPIGTRKLHWSSNAEATMNAERGDSFAQHKEHHYVLHWSMGANAKNLLFDPEESVLPTGHSYKTRRGVQLSYPYFSLASRILLARQVGIAMSDTRFVAQSQENLTWSESIDLVNFYLEREAAVYAPRSHSKPAGMRSSSSVLSSALSSVLSPSSSFVLFPSSHPSLPSPLSPLPQSSRSPSTSQPSSSITSTMTPNLVPRATSATEMPTLSQHTSSVVVVSDPEDRWHRYLLPLARDEATHPMTLLTNCLADHLQHRDPRGAALCRGSTQENARCMLEQEGWEDRLRLYAEDLVHVDDAHDAHDDSIGSLKLSVRDVLHLCHTASTAPATINKLDTLCDSFLLQLEAGTRHSNSDAEVPLDSGKSTHSDSLCSSPRTAKKKKIRSGVHNRSRRNRQMLLDACEGDTPTQKKRRKVRRSVHGREAPGCEDHSAPSRRRRRRTNNEHAVLHVLLILEQRAPGQDPTECVSRPRCMYLYFVPLFPSSDEADDDDEAGHGGATDGESGISSEEDTDT